MKRGQNIVENRRGGRPAPTTVNSSVRTREYLTTAEIERLMAAARKSSRYGHRDATMILIGYRHGLRASELCDLQWSQVELATGRLHVRRAKNGTRPATPAARTGGILASLYDRAGRADDAQGLPCAIRSDWGSGQDAIPGTSAHAATWLRLCLGQRGPRHTGARGPTLWSKRSPAAVGETLRVVRVRRRSLRRPSKLLDRIAQRGL